MRELARVLGSGSRSFRFAVLGLRPAHASRVKLTMTEAADDSAARILIPREGERCSREALTRVTTAEVQAARLVDGRQ
jgi:hypothetical protein